MKALFQAFEKHQYYRLVDLQKLTGQPPGYVKEVSAFFPGYFQDIARNRSLQRGTTSQKYVGAERGVPKLLGEEVRFHSGMIVYYIDCSLDVLL